MTFRDALADAFLHFLWQGAAIGLVASVILQTLRSRTAAARHAVCLVALALCAVIPAVTTWLLYAHGGFWMGEDSPLGLARLLDVSGSVPNVSAGAWLAGAHSLVLPVWIAGVLVSSVRLVHAGRSIHGLRVSALEPPAWIVTTLARVAQRLAVASPVRIALSNTVMTPSVIGWVKPLVLLPASLASGLTTNQLETIIAHELAHIRRYDYLVNLLQTVVESLLFFHPVVWWLSARARLERELSCDDIVLRHYDERVVYARALVSVERFRVAAPAFTLGATDGPLGARVRRILGMTPTVPRSIAVPALTVVCVIAACVGGSIVDPQERRELTNAVFRVDDKETVAVAFRATRAEALVLNDDIELIGRKVARIQIAGLSDDTRARLELPVRIGDLVTAETERQLEQKVHTVNRDLRTDLVPLPDGQAAVMIHPDTGWTTRTGTVRPDIPMTLRATRREGRENK